MGIVFDIARCSYHDGPGIRTAVFLKGCNLHCPWCHNPESIRPMPEIELLPALCVGCGACERACERGVHRLTDGTHRLYPASCTLCGKCVSVCPVSALKVTGREMRADEVMDVVLRDRAYYEASGGGVTFTGGEPTCQPAFLLELLEKSRELGIRTAIETNGCMPPDTLDAILPLTDLFLLDLKADDEKTLRAWTGGSFAAYMHTLETIDRRGGAVHLRLPIIPTYNDTEAHFAFAANLKRRFSCIGSVEILPYHTIGNGKWAGVGRELPLPHLPAATEAETRLWNRMLSDALRKAEAD